MIRNYIAVVYGFKRSERSQQCIREFITDTVYKGDDAAFESNYFSTIKDSPIDYVSDWASGKGNFELLGIGLQNKKKLSADINKIHKSLIEKVKESGLDYDTLVSMYGEPEVHVETYFY